MLQSFRERMQGIVAWTIVIAICITFALWGVQNYLHGGGGNDYVAKVNGNKITQKKLMTAYDVLRKSKINQLGADFQIDQAAQSELKKQALKNLIKEEVLLQAADKMGMFVADNEVMGFINALPQFQRNGVFANDRYIQFINAAYNGNQAEFIAEIHKALIFTQLEGGIRVSEFVLPQEVSVTNKLVNQTRDFSYYLAAAKNLRNNIKLNDADIENYYNKNKDKFATDERVSIEYIQLSADDFKNKVKLDEKNLAGKDKAEYIKQQAMQMFSDQYEKLSDLTYTNSDNLTTAASSLGLTVKSTDLFTAKGEASGLLANKKVVKAAFGEAVLQQGYNSNPIEISQGNVIVLRVKQHIPKDVQPLAKVLPEIQDILKQQKAESLAKSAGEELIAQLQQKQDVKSLVKQNNLLFKSYSNVGRQSKQINQQILTAAFNLPNPQSDGVSVKGIALDNGDYAVVLVNKVYEGKDVTPAFGDTQKILMSEFGSFDYSLFVKGLMDKAKIKIEDLSKSSDDAASNAGDSEPDDNN